MSSATWTPAALASEARRIEGGFWRMVDAQHQASTLKLVDNAAEQAVLESLLEADAAHWMVPGDYRATQALAAAVRAVPLQAIRYASVRHPDHRACIALLNPNGFAAPRPDPATQTWWPAVDAHGAHWVREGERVTFRFSA